MSQIKKVLEARNKKYFEMTQKILPLFLEKLNKAVQYFIKLDRDVKWVTVEFVPGNSNFVYVTGVLEVAVGDIVMYSDTDKIEVDQTYIDENSSKTIVRTMLSVDDLETKDAKELYQKLKDYYTLSGYMPQEEIIKILAMAQYTDLSQILEQLTTPTSTDLANVASTSFDLSTLSKDQIAQYKFYSETSKSKN